MALILISCNTTPPGVVLPYTDNYQSLASLKHYKEWGTYNVHDPACIKTEDYYYVYSTDAYLGNPLAEAQSLGIKTGNIPIRRSRDLVHWEFVGWALDSIPSEAVRHVHQNNNNRGADNIWAPYVIRYGGKYRLYFCVSAFATNVSCIGLAEADRPEGPWNYRGIVLATNRQDKMNAIDPSVIIDGQQRHWLHYGSYFDGLYCVELNPGTGFTLIPSDQGHCTARRYNLSKDNVEAPEIIYNPKTEYYYLFVSYDPLMTTYNIRVGRSRQAQGPFLDYFGRDLSETDNNVPLLSHAYRFNNNEGWAGTGHCGLVNDGEDRFYVLHQGRLSPENHQMLMHVREVFWTTEGWPVFSPERYAGIKTRKITKKQLTGKWEIIQLKESSYKRGTYAGQILWGENRLAEEEICLSKTYVFNDDGSVEGFLNGKWSYQNNCLTLNLDDMHSSELLVHRGLDWENYRETVLFAGLDRNGCSIWGKKIY
ncbi:MAG: arabinan endo-1,5-alpha-L-arabinosidase [Bacteroidales bacterium]|nr:arabinan endo-1,5-alpha-L-arabinosidase [Bacteroidales bacterium]